MSAKQLARIGLFHIEEAILETLFHAGGEYVRAADISRALGISQSWNDSDWIVSSILYKLEEDKRVESRMSTSGQRTGWKLASIENNRRTDT